MLNRITIIIIYCLCSLTAVAQVNYTVTGSVTDTTTKQKVDGATIVILNAKDSIIQKFTYTNKGVFKVDNLKPGKFLLVVTYPDYADYSADFTLDAAHPSKEFGDLSLILKARLLNEVIIKAKVIPIKLKGDTTEFNAAAYATQKNAKVEDLLKLLPGMRINQSGVILFQGEQVQKMLVDGEEFFGDDPALITKNVRADMVSKIQVYDDKTEQAKKSGLDDGQKVKTINVVLREDKKRGVFGKADAGMGTDKRYAGQLMANKFSPKEKIAVYGNTGNTGNVGLGGGDNSKYGGGFNSYAFNGVGIPVARDGGVHYDGKWNKDKQSLNATYKLGGLNIDRQGTSQSKITLPDGFNTTSSNSTSHSHSFRQSLDAQFNTKLDSLSTLGIATSNATSNASSVSDNNTTTVRGNGVILNNNVTHNSSDYRNKNSYLSVDYHRSLKKPGRSFSTYGDISLNNTKSGSYLKSDLNYYDDNGNLDNTHSSKTDQYKPANTDSRYLYGNFLYTEPLAKHLAISFSMNFSDSKNSYNQQSFNKSAAGAYDVPDLLYSNDYTTTTTAHNYYMALRYNSEKINTGFSGSLGSSKQKQTDNLFDTVLARKFTVFSPHADFFYRFSKAATINFGYNGQTQTPSFYQIQPLRQNNDLLNITIGNPLLKPSFSNAFNFFYRVYQAINDQGVNLRANYNFTSNAIVNNRMTDSAGVNTYQYSNLNGKHPNNWNTYLEVYGHPKGSKLLLLPNISISGNSSYNLINKKLSENRNISYEADLPIRLGATNYSYSVNITASITKNKTNLQQLANDYKGYQIDFHQYNKLPFNFFIGTDGNYNYSAPNRVYPTAISKFLLKAYLGKAFLKEENLKITLTGNDLLNQNTGYNRKSTSDSFTESRDMVIKRFFLLTVTWDFSKFGTLAQPQKP
ncbi:outer membrane beta-barrel protein [Mucilaginibacter sp. UR6-11]|uniref:outer membrane beta-barrel protein n=1 Tax=Mucilaginibacter sp. UR6-11 TaxID=1435644 RepID=UPI001E47F4B8|nr:outer membrane beta-barrel protein [Mucilaginibacter sp. UR6-11]MCC8424349.1 outer membrane beta-barrel protein [Mucilaginibacter sp. UR6-11]